MADAKSNEEQFAARVQELVGQGLDHRVARDQAGAETIPEADRCPRCDGTGNQLMFMYQRCEWCDGKGTRRFVPWGFAGIPQTALLRSTEP